MGNVIPLSVLLLSLMCGCISSQGFENKNNQTFSTEKSLKRAEQSKRVKGVICGSLENVASLLRARKKGPSAYRERLNTLQKIEDEEGMFACETGTFTVEPVFEKTLHFNDGRYNLIAKILFIKYRGWVLGKHSRVFKEYILILRVHSKRISLAGRVSSMCPVFL